ncbi:AraC family transcriptional regulator [Chryseobacterium indologenes]|uniref:helix-turn-helix domain-containing protein n=1 Tax=Chryseobacterium indologenes TaxID=253 RepID=UPI000F4DE19A|nr:AraC family transcriptional regulator [Chryseobacterium indologenes]AYZ35984.1 AraC family transcriptional regulator [Chryseobacterium indologenes]MBF6644769.1 helix-turn-helix transcriptional regulator [Chryseobacterium indologenes]MBU3049891.1 AraC family transcriptional regulator [Chryseobacterium indologenes]MEB4759763.1 AraC family transcriptional regulator [Chryseobacterium indologenes]QQQ71539.1 helix-turn-helix transcriptional regulator [Chryseobacterium indologenes]
MKIFIKNMVCNRCIAAVENIFNTAGISTHSVILGEAEMASDIPAEKMQDIEKRLLESGFERIMDSSHQLIEKIKNLIIVKVGELDIDEDFLLSEFLSSKLHKDYSSLSKTFSQNENVTLEQFFILQKIEKVKELLLYNEFNLTEIAGKLGYKSVQHLSTQFRNVTGFTPTEFKKLKDHHRKPLDSL